MVGLQPSKLVARVRFPLAALSFLPNLAFQPQRLTPHFTMIREIPYAGWSRCLEFNNGSLRLIASLDVGPRILFCGPPDGPNLFKEFRDQAGKKRPEIPDPSGHYWLPWGGHRLWVAPEADYCYAEDNQPVQVEKLTNGSVRLSTPPEQGPGWQRALEIQLHPSDPRATITHRLTALRDFSEPRALWALSIMDIGGTAVVPQPPLGSHPRDLLPNRNLILWPYLSLDDPRLSLGAEAWRIRQDTTRGPLKIGLLHKLLHVDYLNKGWCFRTHFPPLQDRPYPDMGVNCEIFTNQEILEVETLSPLYNLRAGESATHTVEWSIHPLD